MADHSIRFHPVIARIYDPINVYFERVQVPDHREWLAADLSGRVLEVGYGSGAMFPYYESADATIHGIEPDPHMRQQASDKREDRGFAFEFERIAGRVEATPYESDSFDVVLASCVFCSVPHVEAAFQEVARVLKPDGEFRLFDHVRSRGPVGRAQDSLTPLWRTVGGNCHLNRRLERALVKSEAMELRESEKHTVGIFPIREFLRAVAVPG
jgi:ubiquinone/menaquinone biosynthesis C-methylase UbiE